CLCPPGKTQHLLPKSVFDRPGSDRWNLASTTFPDAGPMVRIRFPPPGSHEQIEPSGELTTGGKQTYSDGEGLTVRIPFPPARSPLRNLRPTISAQPAEVADPPPKTLSPLQQCAHVRDRVGDLPVLIFLGGSDAGCLLHCRTQHLWREAPDRDLGQGIGSVVPTYVIAFP